MFREYGDGQVVLPGMEPKTVAVAAGGLAALALALAAGAILARGRN
jgi:hypothetical protein